MAYNYEYPYTDASRTNADWMINTFKEMQAELEEFRELIKEYDISRDEVIQMINAAIALCEKYTDDSIIDFENNTMIPYVANAISTFNQTIRTYIDAQDVYFYQSQSNRTDQIADDLKTYIDNKVINVLNMINPVTGESQTIPEVIDYIVETFHRANALTAAQYDGYELTANAYDSQLISAYAYDFDGVNQVIH